METYNIQAILSVADVNFTSELDNACKSLEVIQSACKTVSGSSSSMLADSGLSEMSASITTFASTAKEQFKSMKGVMDKIGGQESVFAKLGNSMLQVNDKASKMSEGFKKLPDKVAKGVENIQPKLKELVPDTVSKKLMDIGEKGKASLGGLRAKIGEAYYEFSDSTGRFNEEAPKVWKAFDFIADRSDVVKSSVGKIGSALQSTAGIGVKVMNGMASALVSVMGVALKAVGPAAIVGLIVAGLGVMQGQFGDQLGGMLEMVTTEGPKIIETLVSGIVSRIPELMAMGSQLLVGILNAITANLPVIFQSGMQILSSLVQGVLDNLPVIIPAVLNMITTFATSIIQLLPQILILGLEILMNLIEGIVNNIGLVLSSVMTIIQTITDAIINNLPTIIAMGIQILLMLVQGIVQCLPQIIMAVLQSISAIIDTVSACLPQIIQAGVMILMMLIQGLIDNLPVIIDTAIQVIQSLIQGIVDNLPQIIEAGFQLILMLIIGIVQMLPEILNAGWEIIKSLASGIVEAIPKILKSVIDGIKGIFTGLWDFITGKSKEGSDNTKTQMDNLSKGITESTSAMNENTKLNFSDMNLGISSNVNGLTTDVAGSFNAMNTGASGATADMLNNVSSNMAGINNTSLQGMEASYNNSFASIQTIVSSAMQNIIMIFTNGMNTIRAVVISGSAGINSAVMSMHMMLYSAGVFAMQGLTSGINAESANVVIAAKAVARRIVETMKRELKINSPSKVTMQIGRYAGMGPAAGLMEMLPKVEKASQRLSDTVANAMSPVSVSDFIGTGRRYSYANYGGLAVKYGADGSHRLGADYIIQGIKEALTSENRTYVFESHTDIEGREVARATAVYTQEELKKLESRNNRRRGYR